MSKPWFRFSTMFNRFNFKSLFEKSFLWKLLRKLGGSNSLVGVLQYNSVMPSSGLFINRQLFLLKPHAQISPSTPTAKLEYSPQYIYTISLPWRKLMTIGSCCSSVLPWPSYPLSFYPHEYTWLLASSAKTWALPAAILTIGELSERMNSISPMSIVCWCCMKYLLPFECEGMLGISAESSTDRPRVENLEPQLKTRPSVVNIKLLKEVKARESTKQSNGWLSKL